jgi:Zinc finger, C3HC4 type (RING finger)
MAMEVRSRIAAETAAVVPFHCIICFEEFKLHERLPVVLPCGHTFVCGPCSQRLTRCMECREPLYYTVPKNNNNHNNTNNNKPAGQSSSSPMACSQLQQQQRTTSRGGGGGGGRYSPAVPVAAHPIHLPSRKLPFLFPRTWSLFP